MLPRPPPSVCASQFLICVWVSLSLSLPYPDLSELPPGSPETPEFRAQARTLSWGLVGAEMNICIQSPGFPLMVGEGRRVPVLVLTQYPMPPSRQGWGHRISLGVGVLMAEYKTHHLNPDQSSLPPQPGTEAADFP